MSPREGDGFRAAQEWQGGKTVFRAEAAEALIGDMRQVMRAIDQKAAFADDAERDDVLSVYRQGIAGLRERLKRVDD